MTFTIWNLIGLAAFGVVCALALCALIGDDEPSAGDLDHMSEAQRVKAIALRRVR